MTTILITVLIAAIGALVAYLLQLIISVPRFMWRYLISRKKARIEGDWHEYHFTRSDKTAELSEQRWNVKKSFSGNLVVEADSLKREDILYRGTVRLELNHWVLTVDGVNHQERVIVRLLNPVSVSEKPLIGIWAGLDFDGNAGAGPILLTRQVLERDEAERLLRQVEVDADHRLLGYS